MVSKGRIWSQSNKVSATKGTSVTLSACQCTNVDCPPWDVEPCVCCHAGILSRSDARLSNASSPPWEGEEHLRKEDRKGRVFAEMHEMDPLQPDFQSCTFKCHQLSCPSSRMF